MVFTHGGHYSLSKRKEVLSRGTTWPNPEGTILGEGRESEKDKHHVRETEPVRAADAEKGMVDARDGEGTGVGAVIRESPLSPREETAALGEAAAPSRLSGRLETDSEVRSPEASWGAPR